MFSLTHRSVSGSYTICNRPSPLLIGIVSLRFPFYGSPQGFKTCLLGRESSPTPTSASYRSVTGSDVIYNSLSPPLANIVHCYKEYFIPFSNRDGISAFKTTKINFVPDSNLREVATTNTAEEVPYADEGHKNMCIIIA